jgi:site-specific DNA-methyltransferase (adenine-specific)
MITEQIGNAALICGDAREVMPSVVTVCDAIITDPVWPNCPEGLLRGADGTQADLFADVLRVVDPTVARVVVILGFDSDPRFLSAVPSRFPFIRSQQLPYAMPGYRGRLLGGDEVAYTFGSIPKGRGVIPGRARTETTPKATRATGHPCPRSDTHMTQLVGWWSLEGVIDPFMGTGSTGVACATLGRPFVGIELDPQFFDLACARIEAAHKQQRLFA